MNTISKELQKIKADIVISINLYKSLVAFVSSMSSDFDLYEEKAKTFDSDYFDNNVYPKKINENLNEAENSNEVTRNSCNNFLLEILYVYVIDFDNLMSKLEGRQTKYVNIHTICLKFFLICTY